MYGMSIYTNNCCTELEGSRSLLICHFHPHPNTLQVTTEHRLKIVSTECHPGSELTWILHFGSFLTSFVNLAVLGTFWELNVLVCNIYQLSQKVVKAGLVFSSLRWGTATWQSYMPARQPLCQWRPDPDQTHSFLTAILPYCSIISWSNWKFSSQTTFLKLAV